MTENAWNDYPVHQPGAIGQGWAYCWRCGRKINPRNTNEVHAGVHNRCQSRTMNHARPGDAMIKIDIPAGTHKVVAKITER